MAVTAVSVTELALNTVSAELTDAAGGVVATTPADGWAVTLGKFTPERLIFKFSGDASGDATVTFLAGDNPAALRSGLGNLASFAIAANGARFITVEGSRFVQNDGTIVVTCVDAGTRLLVLGLPVSQGLGGPGVA